MIQKKCISIVLFYFVLFLMNGCGNAKNKQENIIQEEKFNVIIKATKISSYCGGAKPTPEIEKEHRRKKTYANAEIYIRKGKINTFDSKPYCVVKTDSNGIAVAKLPEGDFVFVFDNKANNESYMANLKIVDESINYRSIDENCLKQFFEKPETFIKVSKEKNNTVTMHRHFPCSWSAIPCAVFVGSVPPSVEK